VVELITREVRRDPTTGLWSVISTERVERPVHLEPRRIPPIPPESCPFCPGNERATAKAIDVVADDQGWLVRAFPNKYTALTTTLVLEGRAYGPYDHLSGVGAHEVIVEGREHHLPLWEQPVERMVQSLTMARRRMQDLHGDFRLLYLAWFRNYGAECGSSQVHPHAQLLGLPYVPLLVREMVRRGRLHLRHRGRELMKDILDYDRDEQKRVVWEDANVIAVCPWAPRAPFEVWIVPTAPGAHFREASDTVLVSAAVALHHVNRAISRELEDPPHNVILYTAPREAPADSGFRWHLRVMPRLEPYGGFETGTHGALVSVPPEEAARVLREG